MLTKPSHNKCLSCAGRLIVLSGVSAFTLLLGLASPAKAAVTETQVAVATATNLKAIGKPPVSPARELKTGVGVFFSEKISTNQVGRAQLLFEDGTALTVGPTSDLVIDEYVYDPKAGTGAMTVSISKGFFRLVGGKISKKNPIKFLAPNATVGVRGGIVLLELSEDGVLTADLLFGDELTVTSGGKTQRTTQAGRFISVVGANAIPLPSQQRSSIDLTRLVGAFQRHTVTQSVADNLLAATEKKQQTAEKKQQAKAEHQAAKKETKEAQKARKKAGRKVDAAKNRRTTAAGKLVEATSDRKTSQKSIGGLKAKLKEAQQIKGPAGKVARKAAKRALRRALNTRSADKKTLAAARTERTKAKRAKQWAVKQRTKTQRELRAARKKEVATRKQLRVARKDDRNARRELRAATKRIRALGSDSFDSKGSHTGLTINSAVGSIDSHIDATVEDGKLSAKGDSGTDAPISVTVDAATGEASISCGSVGDCDSMITVKSSGGSTTVLVISKLTKSEKKAAKADKAAKKKATKAAKKKAQKEKQAKKKAAKKAKAAKKKAAKKAKATKKKAQKEKQAKKKAAKKAKSESKSESEAEECDAEVSECETRLPAGVVALWAWSADGGARIETTVSGRPIGSLPKLTRRPCTECRFLAWGRETLVSATPDTSRVRYWLTGAAATAAELAAAADKSATYSGAMLGGVLRAGSIVERRGSFDARVRFGTTHYQVNAFDASFDGRRFHGASARTGNAALFNVKTTSTSWVSDSEKTHTLRAGGYFFGRGASAGDTPPEMGGHFRITGDRYQAGGVFAGRKR